MSSNVPDVFSNVLSVCLVSDLASSTSQPFLRAEAVGDGDSYSCAFFLRRYLRLILTVFYNSNLGLTPSRTLRLTGVNMSHSISGSVVMISSSFPILGV